MSIQPIIDAIRSGSIKTVRTATKGVELSAEDLGEAFIEASKTGKKPIVTHIHGMGDVPASSITLGVMELVKLGKQPLVEAYIDAIDDINTKDKSGRTLMSHAAQGGKQKLVDLLADRNADIQQADKKGHPPLMWAMRAKKAKIARWFIDQGVVVKGKAGMEMIEAAPNKPIKEALIESFLQNRVSAMSKEEFVAKWGQIEQIALGALGCEDPLGDPIMKGRLFTAGYFRNDLDPNTLDLDWEAVDAAKTVANQIAAALTEAGCQPFNSEGGDDFTAFFIPSLGRMPKTQDLDAWVSHEAKEAGHGAYDRFIRSYDRYGMLFDDLDSYLADDFIEQPQYDGFKRANAIADAHLTGIKCYYLYSDFVHFPVILGGLDKHFNFVGVITTKVFT